MKHLLSTADLSRAEAVHILDVAEEMAEVNTREVRKLPALRGKTVVNLFFEDSTRTRISFEAAAKRLSADVINFAAKGSSVSKGESLKDTVQTLGAMGIDGIVMRHGASGAPRVLADADWIDVPVVNAGDGTHEHPTQALLDAFTMRRRLHGAASRGKGLDGVRVAIVGDVLHSRVARSNAWLLRTLGAEVTFVAPPTLLPAVDRPFGAAVHHDLDVALAEDPDVVMLLRIQQERMHDAFFPNEREYTRHFGLTAARAASLAERTLIMHPGPMNRGLEIAGVAADDPRSTVVEQVANGVSVRMAVLYLALTGGRRPSRIGRRAARRSTRRRPSHDRPPHPRRAAGRRHACRHPPGGTTRHRGRVRSRHGRCHGRRCGRSDRPPGLVDLHTHLREPGGEESETVRTGSRAAAAGGFTAVNAMANSNPVADTAGVVEQVQALGDDAGYVTVRPIGAVSQGLQGTHLSEIGAMATSRARVRVFSDDGSCVADPLLMRRALEYVKGFGGVIAQHAQEPRLTIGAQMNEGRLSSELGLAGWPAVAEEAIIARDVLLADHVGARLHVCHVSTAGSVEVIRWAKSRGIDVTAEVTPHHLVLTEELIAGVDGAPGTTPGTR